MSDFNEKVKNMAKQTKAVKDLYGVYAGEDVTAEKIRDRWYIYGTEIAVLRLFWKCNKTLTDVQAGYSDNLQTWYFSFEQGK